MREREIFIAALQRDDPKDRRAYVEGACGGDAGLWERVQALFGAFERAGSFLQAPAANLDTTGAIVAAHGNGPERLASPAEDLGAVIGPYKLREQIGEGGMGVVYVAEQTQPVRRKVALKVIKPGMDSRQVVARFEAERQALAMMDHPNIARVFDGGTTPSGRPYFVMELVRGIPITEYCDEQKLTIRERLELFVLVCRAVQHAHQKGIIHRDLKPSNILITLHDGVPVPKVIDFGVAKATGQSLTDKTVYTAFAQLVGTPLYMSPEQVEFSGLDIDTRSDIYSLAVLLYELLTGTTPFDAETLKKAAFDEMRRIIREQEPQSPSTRLSSLGATLTTVSARRKADPRRLGPSLRGELDWIVMKALDKDRRRRYETANDLASDVMRYLSDQPVQAGPPSASYRLRKFVRRNKGPVAAGGALAALLVLGTLGTSIGLVRAVQAERKATIAAGQARTAQALATHRLLEVTKEKDRATVAEAKANQEAAVAKAVREFLQDDVLAEASPDKNPRNKKVTMEEILGRAAARVDGKFAQQPRIEAEIRLTIGETYTALGDFTAAQPHLERAREISRRVMGENHPRTLNFMNSLGTLYWKQGQLSKAESLFVEALGISRGILGNEHRQTLDSMSGLGAVYRAQGQFSKAEPLLVEAMETSQRVLGKHSDVMIVNNLALLYGSLGQLSKAEPLMAKVLEMQRSVLGAEHPVTLLCVNNLAGLYWASMKLDRSVPLFEELLKKRQTDLGSDHPSTLTTMGNLGINYRDAGRLPEATRLLEQAWAKALKQPDLLVSKYAWIGIALAETYDQASQFSKAESLYRGALEEARKRHLVASPQAADVLHSFGLHRLKQQRYADAEPPLRDCLAIREQKLPDNWVTSDTRSLLGGSLLGQTKYVEAEPLLLAGYDGMKQREGKILPIVKSRLTEAVERLVQLYEVTGKKDRADEWRRKLPAATPAKNAEMKNN
jgi:serine/threonine protein kinase/tetratricopeptide (TPR) repeat protein